MKLSSCNFYASVMLSCAVLTVSSASELQAADKPLVTVSVVTPDELMDWAQREYPTFFPDKSSTQLLESYQYRYYPSSKNYLGVSGSDVYVLGPVSGNKLLKVGTLDDFKCKVTPSLCAVASTQTLVAAQSMSASISSDGQLLMWGDPAKTRLAAGSTAAGSVARLIPIRTKQLAVGTYGALILDTEGRVYEYGGIEAGWMYSYVTNGVPHLVPRNQPVKQILVSGRTGNYDQPFYLMQDGTLQVNNSGPSGWRAQKDLIALSYGSGIPHAIRKDGTVIRLENSSTYGNFSEIQGAVNVKMVSCSGYHCLGLKNDGTVIAWGGDPVVVGQNPDFTLRQLQALPIPGLSNVVKVSAGDGPTIHNSAALTADGKLYIWGQLGLIPQFEPVTNFGKAIDVSCGTHCLVLAEDGKLWGWGYNKLAITGTGQIWESELSPVQIEGVK
jgi:alpha-tubulin suppressor-like RCC1 family protein